MITKNYKSIFSYIAAFTIALFMVSCDQEDNTGFATLTPTAPTLSVATSVSTASLIEDNSVYTFTATLSTPQLVDVKLFVSQVEGTATAGSDYTVDGSLIISAGSTSATGEIKILSDDILEETETVKIQIGDETTANAALTPATMEFTILNYTEGDLAIDLSWAMSSKTTDDSGEEIDPVDFADMRLLLTSNPDNTDFLEKADDSGFESLVISSDTPDGEYYIVTDFYSANDEILRDLDFHIEFNQTGLINHESFDFPAALFTGDACSLNYLVIAKVTKNGNNFELERMGDTAQAPDLATLTYDVVSNGESTDSGPTNNPLVDFASTATITNNGDGTFTLSDAWAGVYIDWYSIYGNTAEEPQTFAITTCGTFEASWSDIFGGSQTLTGVVNSDGSISIRIDNQWGDYVDAVYTPQP